MRITKTFPVPPGSPKSYGKPWLAVVVSWPDGGRPQYRWGKSLDTLTIELEAGPGAVVRWGRFRYRGRGTTALWGILEASGAIREVTAAEARTHWEASQSVHS